MDRSMDISLLLVVFSLVFIVWVTRRSWVRKQCPYCRWYIPALATKCENCHEWYPRPRGSHVALMLLGSLVWVGVASAQSFPQSVCSRPSFFAEEECGIASSQPLETGPASAAEAPLFTRETVSPYTAPELLHLANHRTLENARQYVRRTQARSAATEEVTRLVQQAWQEMGVPYAR